MTILTILKYPNPKLREPTEPVTVFDDDLRVLVNNMFTTMAFNNGVGLAAPQVGITKKLAVIQTDKKYVLINPNIISMDGEQDGPEGCLSFPGVFENVKRANHIVVEAQDENGELQTHEVEELTARAMQHEIEHLEGKLLIDHMSTIRRDILRRKIEKDKKKPKGKKYRIVHVKKGS